MTSKRLDLSCFKCLTQMYVDIHVKCKVMIGMIHKLVAITAKFTSMKLLSLWKTKAYLITSEAV